MPTNRNILFTKKKSTVQPIPKDGSRWDKNGKTSSLAELVVKSRKKTHAPQSIP